MAGTGGAALGPVVPGAAPSPGAEPRPAPSKAAKNGPSVVSRFRVGPKMHQYSTKSLGGGLLLKSRQ